MRAPSGLHSNRPENHLWDSGCLRICLLGTGCSNPKVLRVYKKDDRGKQRKRTWEKGGSSVGVARTCDRGIKVGQLPLILNVAVS